MGKEKISVTILLEKENQTAAFKTRWVNKDNAFNGKYQKN
jgi:hypothetical protein